MSKTIRNNSLSSDYQNYINQNYIQDIYINPNNYNDNMNYNINAIQGETRYDPMNDYIFRQKLDDMHDNIHKNNHVKYDIHYINIDSSLRNKSPSYETERPFKLGKDPFKLIHNLNENKSTIKIYYPEHKLIVGDKITINGVQNRKIVLRTKKNNSPFQFINGSKYLKIFYDDGSDPISQNNPNKKNGGLADIDFDAFNLMTDTDQSNLFIKIDGFQGNIGNIPSSTLNKRQRVYLTIPGQNFDNRAIYIKLIHKFSDINSPFIFSTSYNVTITFEYIAGIPINRINSQYPINYNHLQGYQLVTEVDKNSFSIDIYSQPGTLERNFGGSNIYVSKIISMNKGFSNPNQYSIHLDKVYSNVIYISLVSSEFPNVVQNVKEGINNIFYWQNLEDGDKIYKVKLKSGNYTPQSLIYELENAIRTVQRYNFSNIKNQYINENNIKFDININTNIVTIKSFKQAILQQPIINVFENKNNDLILQIKHINHGLNENDVITISGAINHLGIPADVINGTHIITTIDNQDIYSITLPKFNYLEQKIATSGGISFKITVPNLFRLRLDFKDSIGSILGFRNVGSTTSITDYKTIITNQDPYENEIAMNEAGENILIKNNALSFNGYNYFLIMCKQIQIINDNHTSKSYALAKILSAKPSKPILFNTFVNTPQFFQNPIHKLYKLDLSFIDPDGKLHDFNGLDHSFTLKIITMSNKNNSNI